jgi:hypothetical protein
MATIPRGTEGIWGNHLYGEDNPCISGQSLSYVTGSVELLVAVIVAEGNSQWVFGRFQQKRGRRQMMLSMSNLIFEFERLFDAPGASIVVSLDYRYIYWTLC